MEVSSLIAEELENMARVKDTDQIWSKRKALVALFPYAARRKRFGDHRMFDAYFDIFAVPRARELVGRPIVTLLHQASPDSPNWVVTLMLPYGYWGYQLRDGKNAVTRWARAALAVASTEELGPNVVHTLLRIASDSRLLPFLPVDVWIWLKTRPSDLPPICRGRDRFETADRVVRTVRELGDVEILESCFHLVWSEWNYVCDGALSEMHTSIREDFGGIGMWRHREALTKRLDHVLGQLDKGLEYLRQKNPDIPGNHIPTTKERYGRLKEELLEVDREAMEILTRTPFIYSFDSLTKRLSTESHSTFICALPLPFP